MSNDDFWDDFIKSGKISSYLAYKNVVFNDEKDEAAKECGGSGYSEKSQGYYFDICKDE